MRQKLNLNLDMVEKAREAAKEIAESIQDHINTHTTTSIERTVARLLGIDGVDAADVPLPNVVVDQVLQGGELSRGAAYWICNAMLYYDYTAQEVAEEVGKGNINLLEIPAQDPAKVKELIDKSAEETAEHIKGRRMEREQLVNELSLNVRPHIYVIVATGNIYEDVTQAKTAVKNGADIVAVIRSTGQSLLDYVPYGPTTEGFGGTFATQENFRIMREALDEAGKEVGRYIQLCNYCSGLCMPEIAVMGAMERLDMMLNDAMYGILFRDINMERTFVDQHFSRMLNSYAGIIINTGEDNYLTTADAYEAAHTVLTSQFINEQLALISGLPEEQMGLGHAFEMDPDIENGFLYELAQAQLCREIFPKAPLKYMPPTKFMSGNIFKGHIMNAMFNMVAIMTNQGIQLLGMLTEAIHTPHLHDRYLNIENAQYVFSNARNLGDEIDFKEGGIIQRRAQETLEKSYEMLIELKETGFMEAIEQGLFADVKRPRKGGKGRDGVIKRSEDYYNPFYEIFLNRGEDI